MKTGNGIFLNSHLILTLRLFGVFPMNPDTLETSHIDVFYCCCLVVLSIFELIYTPVFILFQKVQMFPANFPSTTAATFFLSCIAALTARYTCLFRMKKYFPKINESIIKSTVPLYMYSFYGGSSMGTVGKAAFISSSQIIFVIFPFVVIFLDSNRLNRFIKQSDNFCHILFYIYYIVFQNWAVICVDDLFVAIAQQLGLNFLKINEQLESILKEAKSVENQGPSHSCKFGKPHIRNNFNKDYDTVSPNNLVGAFSSPYFRSDLRRISDSFLHLNIMAVKVPMEPPPASMHARLRMLLSLHIRCSQALESSNDLFQVHLLSSLGRSFCICFLVIYQHVSRYFVYDCLFTTMIYMYIFLIILRCMLIIAAAFTASSEAQYTKVLITKINNRFLDADTKEELELFWNHITSSKLEFTACGFFTLNTRLIASAFVAGTTYLVILLQFNPEKQPTASQK